MDNAPVLHITVSRRAASALAVTVGLALAAFRPGALSTEQLSMSTYYPSPYGVYKNLRSTDDAAFAYTTGRVGIGTQTPSGKLHVAGTGDVILNTSGNLGVGTANPQAKVHFSGGGGNMLFDANNGIVTVGTTDTSSIYATGLKMAISNIHVQGNENGNWLRVGDAWGQNGVYSEAGNLVLGSATGVTSLGHLNDSQFMGQMCRAVYFGVGGETYCPNGGRGWTIVGYSASPGVIDGGAVPLSGYMHCCKFETP